MSYKLSRRDIRFLAIPYSVTNFLALTPPYRFAPSLLNPSPTKNPTLKHNVQVALQAALLLAASVFSFAKVSRLISNSLDYFLYAIDTFCHYAVTFLIMRSSLLHGNWTKLNNNLQLIDRMLLRQANRTDQTSLWRNPTIHFVSFTVIAMFPLLTFNALTVFMNTRVSTHDDVVANLIMSASMVTCEIANMLIQFLMCSIVLALRERLVDVKLSLVENIKNNVAMLAMLVDVLEDTVTAFNGSFGWIILSLFIHNLMQNLSCIHLLITNFDVFELHGISVSSVNIYAGILLYSTLIVWIVLACDSAGKELKEIGKLAKELQNENKAMTSLVYCCNKLQFTAAGLVVVDRKTLFQFLSVMTTYLIVLLQLRTN